jgi:hypothetical protein
MSSVIIFILLISFCFFIIDEIINLFGEKVKSVIWIFLFVIFILFWLLV